MRDEVSLAGSNLFLLLARWFSGPIKEELLRDTAKVNLLWNQVTAGLGLAQNQGPSNGDSQSGGKSLLSPCALVESLACEHNRIFGFEVFPLEGEFTGAGTDSYYLDQLLTELGNAYLDAEMEGDAVRNLRADHIGLQFQYVGTRLAELSEDSSSDRGKVRSLAGFIDRHIFNWVVPLRTAVFMEGGGPFAGLLDTAIDYLELIREDLVGRLEGEDWSWSGAGTNALANAALATDERRSQAKSSARAKSETESEEEAMDKRLIQMLLDPARSGIYVSRRAIRQLGRSLDLPVPFGDRKSMLKSLMEHCTAYDLREDMGGQIKSLVHSYASSLQSQGNARGLWLERIGRTHEVLDRNFPPPQN